MLDKWCAERPEIIQRLVREFSSIPFIQDEADGITRWFVGATEDGRLIYSRLDPEIDYAKALAGPIEYLDPEQLRPYLRTPS